MSGRSAMRLPEFRDAPASIDVILPGGWPSGAGST
jgi:hypothetical protein